MEKINPKFTWCEISPYTFEPTEPIYKKFEKGDGVYFIPYGCVPSGVIINSSGFPLLVKL